MLRLVFILLFSVIGLAPVVAQEINSGGAAGGVNVQGLLNDVRIDQLNNTINNQAGIITNMQTCMAQSRVYNPVSNTTPPHCVNAGMATGAGMVGSVWTNMLSTRALSTTYTNTLAYHLYVTAAVASENDPNVCEIQAFVGGVRVDSKRNVTNGNTGETDSCSLTIMVPPGQTYSFSSSYTSTPPVRWMELR